MAAGAQAPAAAQGAAVPDRAIDARDAQSLETLRSAGADLARPQTPVYFTSFPSAAAEKRARRELEAQGFRVMKAAAVQDGQTWVLILTRTMPLSVDNVRRTSRDLEALTARHGGRYVGWDAEPRR
jgi:hypothetical protein